MKPRLLVEKVVEHCDACPTGKPRTVDDQRHGQRVEQFAVDDAEQVMPLRFGHWKVFNAVVGRRCRLSGNSVTLRLRCGVELLIQPLEGRLVVDLVRTVVDFGHHGVGLAGQGVRPLHLGEHHLILGRGHHGDVPIQ